MRTKATINIEDDSFIHRTLTKCMDGTPFDVPEYLRLRKEIILRKPFYITYTDYLLSKLRCLLIFCFSKRKQPYFKEENSYSKRLKEN